MTNLSWFAWDCLCVSAGSPYPRNPHPDPASSLSPQQTGTLGHLSTRTIFASEPVAISFSQAMDPLTNLMKAVNPFPGKRHKLTGS